MKTNTQQGSTPIIMGFLLVAVLAVAASLLWSTQKPASVTPSPLATPYLQSSADLDKMLKELDSVNPSSLDSGLSEVAKSAGQI